MRTLISRRPQAFLLILPAILAAVLACNLPISLQKGGDLSQEQALQLVLDEIVKPDQLDEDPLVVFAWPDPILPGDALHPYNFLGEHTIPGLAEIEAESWFFWIEDEPYARFSHPSRFVLVEINSGKITSSEQEWWPVLNGEGLWINAEEYQNEDNWAWSNVSFKNPEETSSKGSSSVMSAMLLPQIASAQAEGGSRKALVINTITEKQSNVESSAADAKNMLDILDKTDFTSTYLGDKSDENPRRVGTPFLPGEDHTNNPWRVWLRTQAEEMESGDTLVVYISGHGQASKASGEGWVGNEIGGIFGDSLHDELGKFNPGVDIIVIVEACKSGAFTKNLEDVADLTLTSTNATTSSYADLDFIFSWIWTLGLTDLNPFDEGGEYTSSLVAGWEEVLDDPELMDKVKQRAKDEGISFMDALISEAYEEGSIYDLPARLGLSEPQTSYGSNKGRQKAPDDSPDPTKTPTQKQTPTISYRPYLGDFRVSLDIKMDPNEVPADFNWLTYIKTTITVKDDPFRIEGPYPWITVSGELNPDGSINATGSGTMEDRPLTNVTFKGYITPDAIEGEYTFFLPSGQLVVYRVSGERKEQEATPTPTSTSTPASEDSEQACAVFEEIEILDTIMRHMRDCIPTLNFYYKMDTGIPGLASASPIAWDYRVLVNGKQGNCFLEEGFEDRLYCQVDISADEAYTLGHFILYANPCQEPISVLDLTIPELEGCGEPLTEPEEPDCDS